MNENQQEEKIFQLNSLSDEGNQSELSIKKEKLDKLLLNLPNIPHESAPEGQNEDDNKVISTWDSDIIKDFTLKTHLELGKSLKLFDFERSAKISGSGFPLYTGKGALLERSLINFMLDFHTKENR